MAWRKPTRDDLVATLSQKEVDAFARSADFTIDPIDTLLERTASFARMHIKSNGNVRMSPSEHELPESVISAAMDYAAFDVLKRLSIKVGEDRAKARADAAELFRAIASGKITPESYGDDESSSSGGPTAEVVTSVRPRVTAHKLEGL